MNWGYVVGIAAVAITILAHLVSVTWFLSRLNTLVSVLEKGLAELREEFREDLGRVERIAERAASSLEGLLVTNSGMRQQLTGLAQRVQRLEE